jgi:site-specific DNA-adenine methylase
LAVLQVFLGAKKAMSYLGSKAASGVYQKIIAEMPPHDTYIETHLGGGAVMLRKPPARHNGGSISTRKPSRRLTRAIMIFWIDWLILCLLMLGCRRVLAFLRLRLCRPRLNLF